jgi:predicted amidohydrolase YtcJ
VSRSALGARRYAQRQQRAAGHLHVASGRTAVTPGISRRQALDMWTRQAAHVLRWEGIGSLEPGHHADLVVVDRDPLRCPLHELLDTRVIATMLGGQTVAGADLVGNVRDNGDSRARHRAGAARWVV